MPCSPRARADSTRFHGSGLRRIEHKITVKSLGRIPDSAYHRFFIPGDAGDQRSALDAMMVQFLYPVCC